MKSAYSIRRPVDNLHLVRERDRHRRRELLWVVAVAVPVALGVLAYVWLSQELLNAGYRVQELDQQLERLLQTERRLKVEVSYLAGHERVEREAQDRLGLAPATPEQVVFLGDGR